MTSTPEQPPWEREFHERFKFFCEEHPCCFGDGTYLKVFISKVEQDAIRRTKERWTVHADGDIYVLRGDTYEYVGYLAHEGTAEEAKRGLELLRSSLHQDPTTIS